jgi:hypothetical protein
MIAGYFYYGGFGIHLGRSFQKLDFLRSRQKGGVICLDLMEQDLREWGL